MKRFIRWLSDKLHMWANKVELDGPLYLVDLAGKRGIPVIIKGPMEEAVAKTWCPAREVMSPALARYGVRGPQVKYEWDCISLAWRKPRAENQSK